ncbi:hypothetical protein DM01DRAFT_1154819 [Hesseltinella vesiculosa]|uniref:CTLH domain-containing protein n=1 Tax=Hesseltinella vesiculosa TaxID=101127 RepID=A0A1X2G654_9FUNG|nr:hypothetical protein DM01DRAFT_1154819 [Hesseltinella vesiculosa]
MNGKIDQAISLTNEHYPIVLQDKSDMAFELLCGKFIENVRQFNDHHHSPMSSPWSSQTSSPLPQPTRSTSQPPNSPSPEVSTHRRPSWAAIAAAAAAPSPATLDTATDLPPHEQGEPLSRTTSDQSHHSLDQASQSSMSTDSSDPVSPRDDMYLHDVLASGEQLKDSYAKDKRPYIQEKLKQVFSLFAYKSIQQSSCPSLLSLGTRDELATKLITCILDHLGFTGVTELERIYKQIILVSKQLAYDGDGESSILNQSSFTS